MVCPLRDHMEVAMGISHKAVLDENQDNRPNCAKIDGFGEFTILHEKIRGSLEDCETVLRVFQEKKCPWKREGKFDKIRTESLLEVARVRTDSDGHKVPRYMMVNRL